MTEKALETTLTVKQLNQAGKPDGVVFRQTLNRDKKRWYCPKRRLEDGSWRVIEQKEKITDSNFPFNPYMFALWRIKKIMLSIRYENGPEVWKCDRIIKYRGRAGYTVFYLYCKRAIHSIQGVM